MINFPAINEEFVRGSIEAKIALNYIGLTWGLLPPALENDAIVESFHQFLSGNVPFDIRKEDGKLDSAKYEQAIQSLSSAYRIRPDQIEDFLFDYFRVSQVEEAFRSTGFALPLEAKLDLRSNDLLWKYDAVTLDPASFEPDPVPFASIAFHSVPENNDTLTLVSDNSSKTFTFRDALSEKPDSGDVLIGTGDSEKAKLASTRENLAAAMKQMALGYVMANKEEDNGTKSSIGLNLSLPQSGASFIMPQVSISGGALSTTNELKEELLAYYERHKADELFVEPNRTRATALEFSYKQYLKDPVSPTEAELRSYFVQRPGEFSLPGKKESPPIPIQETQPQQPEVVNPEKEGRPGPPGLQGRPSVRKSRVSKKEKAEDKPPAKPVDDPKTPVSPADAPAAELKAEVSDPGSPVASDNNGSQVADGNGTSPETDAKGAKPARPATFEEVRDQVLARVMEERRADREREARAIAEKRAEECISELHSLARKLSLTGIVALKARNDPRVTDLIQRLQPTHEKKVLFSESETKLQARISGLPTGALSDLLDLPGHRFFSEATYETDNGFAVMLLEGKLAASVKAFDQVNFRVLLREFRTEHKQNAFQAFGEEIAKAIRGGLKEQTPLKELAEKIDSRLLYHSSEGDNQQTLQRSFEKRSRKLDREINKAQSDLDKLVELHKDRNATTAEETEVSNLREVIKAGQDQRGQLTDELGLAEEIFAVASDVETKPGNLTSMVFGPSSKAGLFVRLEEVILEIDDEEDSLVKQRVDLLERQRANDTRESLLVDWIKKGRKDL